MKSRIRAFLLSFVFVITSSCYPNLYNGMSPTGTDAALLIQMSNHVNASSWDAAIADYQLMSGTGQTSRSAMFKMAQALAGRCGFDFLTFFNSLSGVNFGAGGSAMMLWLMNAYKGKTINMVVSGANPSLSSDSPTGSYCAWSQKFMDDLKTIYGSWNSDERLFVFVFNLAKMGMILRNFGDLNGVGGLGDNYPDAGFDTCKSAALKDFYVVQLVASFSLVLSEGPVAMSSMAAALNTLYSVCSAAPAAGLGLTMCDHKTPATVTGADIKNMRGILMLYNAALTANIGLWGGAPTFGETVAATDPAPTALWQCNGLAAVAGTLGCCP